nr:MAG TPA: hypothetical protein [Bacteriophage sp.]
MKWIELSIQERYSERDYAINENVVRLLLVVGASYDMSCL